MPVCRSLLRRNTIFSPRSKVGRHEYTNAAATAVAGKRGRFNGHGGDSTMRPMAETMRSTGRLLTKIPHRATSLSAPRSSWPRPRSRTGPSLSGFASAPATPSGTILSTTSRPTLLVRCPAAPNQRRTFDRNKAGRQRTESSVMEMGNGKCLEHDMLTFTFQVQRQEEALAQDPHRHLSAFSYTLLTSTNPPPSVQHPSAFGVLDRSSLRRIEQLPRQTILLTPAPRCSTTQKRTRKGKAGSVDGIFGAMARISNGEGSSRS